MKIAGNDPKAKGRPRRLLRLSYLFAIITPLLDQLTKWVVIQSIDETDINEVIPGFFNLEIVLNRGAAFGILSGPDGDWTKIFFIVATLLSVTVLAYLMHNSFNSNRWTAAALGLILGGAVGNLIDRLHIGAVVDFLDVYIGSYHWPAFNVADSAITIGAGVLIVVIWRRGDSQQAST